MEDAFSVPFILSWGKQITMNKQFYNLQKKQVQYLCLYSTETYTSRYRNSKSNKTKNVCKKFFCQC